MCGRYTLVVDQDDLEERFDARFETGSRFSPRYNAAPGQQLPVVTNDEPETIRTLEWGLVPSWADDANNGIINARAETVAEKPSFREAYSAGDQNTQTPSAGRCLVLADGFYEWVETGDGKTPYRVAFEDDRPFAMAGLWARWEPETTQTGLGEFGGGTGGASEGEPTLETFTILTAEPNTLVADLHDRMAVILEPGSERRWLTDEGPGELLEPHPATEMRAYPVSTAVNSPANDDPSVIEPVDV